MHRPNPAVESSRLSSHAYDSEDVARTREAISHGVTANPLSIRDRILARRVQAFRAGGDIHRQTAAIIFDVPLDQVTKDMRARAKTINFATIYGQGGAASLIDSKLSATVAAQYLPEGPWHVPPKKLTAREWATEQLAYDQVALRAERREANLQRLSQSLRNGRPARFFPTQSQRDRAELSHG